MALSGRFSRDSTRCPLEQGSCYHTFNFWNLNISKTAFHFLKNRRRFRQAVQLGKQAAPVSHGLCRHPQDRRNDAVPKCFQCRFTSGNGPRRGLLQCVQNCRFPQKSVCNHLHNVGIVRAAETRQGFFAGREGHRPCDQVWRALRSC